MKKSMCYQRSAWQLWAQRGTKRSRYFIDEILKPY